MDEKTENEIETTVVASRGAQTLSDHHEEAISNPKP